MYYILSWVRIISGSLTEGVVKIFRASHPRTKIEGVTPPGQKESELVNLSNMFESR